MRQKRYKLIQIKNVFSIPLSFFLVIFLNTSCTSSIVSINHEESQNTKQTIHASTYKFDSSIENCSTYPEIQKGTIHREWLRTYPQIRNCLSKEPLDEREILKPIYLYFAIRKDQSSSLLFNVSNVEIKGAINEKTKQCIKSVIGKMQVRLVEDVDVRIHLNPLIADFMSARRLIIDRDLLVEKINHLEVRNLEKNIDKERLKVIQEKINKLEVSGYSTTPKDYEIKPSLYCSKRINGENIDLE